MAGICEGRVVLVTGAGRGIGRCHALAFASEGARVLVNDIGTGRAGDGSDEAPALEVATAIRSAGGEAIVNHADVADWDQAGAMIQQALHTWGRLDVVVNNAGFLRDKMFAGSSVDDWDGIMRVHLRGHYCPTRHAVAHWRAQAKAGEAVDARIINTSSGSGLQGSIGQSNYAAAKAGIAALTIVQAAELGRYGITANAIAPMARTRMTEPVYGEMMAAPEDGFDVMAPDNVSPLVVWLGSPESRDVTGRVFEVYGGKISVADGWRTGPEVDKGSRWEPAEVGQGVREILGKAAAGQKVYGT